METCSARDEIILIDELCSSEESEHSSEIIQKLQVDSEVDNIVTSK